MCTDRDHQHHNSLASQKFDGDDGDDGDGKKLIELNKGRAKVTDSSQGKGKNYYYYYRYYWATREAQREKSDHEKN